MELDNALYFDNSIRWREWLQHNHNKAKEIWLIHYKKNSGKAGISYDEALTEAICFGWIDGRLRSIDEERYIIRYSPRKTRSIWSKFNREKAEELIKSGRMTEAGLVKIKEAKENGYWDSAYTNKEQEEIPSDLEGALIKDDKAWYNFQHFANSYRNNYIGWINNAKTEETRNRRISEVVKRASSNIKPGM